MGIASSFVIWLRCTSRHRKDSPDQAGIWLPLTADLPAKSWGPAACLILSLLLVFGYRWPLIGSLSVVQAFNAGRYLLFVAFFLCAMVGVGSVALVGFFRSRGRRVTVFTVLLLVVFTDLGPATFQQPYIRGSELERPQLVGTEATGFLRSEAARFANGEIPNNRNYFATDTEYRPLAISYLPVSTGLVTFLGLYNEALLATTIFCQPLEKLLNSAIRTAEKLESPGQHSFGFIQDALHLTNVRRFMARSTDRSELMIWRTPTVSPVVVSPKVTGWDLLSRNNTGIDKQSAFLRLVKQMGINGEKNTCERILLATREGTEDLGTDPSVRVLEHRVWNQRVEMVIRTSSPCFARLAYAFYPYLSVTVNGNKVVPYQTAGSFIALRLSEGEHRIVLEPVLSPLRRGLLGLSLAIVVACFAYFGWRARHHWPIRYFLEYKRRKQEH